MIAYDIFRLFPICKKDNCIGACPVAWSLVLEQSGSPVAGIRKPGNCF
jgi:hypothetical protein